MDCVGNRETADCKAFWLLLPFQERFFAVLKIRSFNRRFDLGWHCKQTELTCARVSAGRTPASGPMVKNVVRVEPLGPSGAPGLPCEAALSAIGLGCYTAILYLQDWRLSRWLDSKEKTQLYVRFSSKVDPQNRRIDVSRTYCGLLLCLRVCVFSSLAGRTMSEWNYLHNSA